VTVTDATFDELVLRAGRPVLVDFWAVWCAPCRMVAPVLAEIAAEQAGRLVVAEVDVDTNPESMRRAGVLGMPTLVLYIGGEEAARVLGARPKAALLRLLEQHVDLWTTPA
jgi:thioredoxin 1